jgi:hypothetical protein
MLANLRALFGVVVDIVLLRRGPEHLPASPQLLGVVLAIYLAVYMVLTALVTHAPANWPLQLLVVTAIQALLLHAGLVAANKRERFTQTTTAYFAASTLFLPILVPLESMMRPFMSSPEAMREAPVTLVVPGAVFGIWAILVQARVVRSAFEWRLFLAIIFIIAMNFVSALLLALLFGTPKPAA